MRFKRIELENHKNTYERAIKSCQFCKREFNDIEMEEHHNLDCQEITIDCEKRCILRYKCKNKELQDLFSCEKTKHDCYFWDAGCYFTGTVEENGRHASEAFILHASFLEQKYSIFNSAPKSTINSFKKSTQSHKNTRTCYLLLPNLILPKTLIFLCLKATSTKTPKPKTGFWGLMNCQVYQCIQPTNAFYWSVFPWTAPVWN